MDYGKRGERNPLFKSMPLVVVVSNNMSQLGSILGLIWVQSTLGASLFSDMKAFIFKCISFPLMLLKF